MIDLVSYKIYSMFHQLTQILNCKSFNVVVVVSRNCENSNIMPKQCRSTLRYVKKFETKNPTILLHHLLQVCVEYEYDGQ